MRHVETSTRPSQQPIGGLLHYQAGGTLGPEAVYVSRPCDEQLPSELLKGHLCYVLAPRQIGKSSLRSRTSRQLRAAGVSCATVDLSGISSRQDSLETWYFSLADELSHQLAIPSPLSFFSAHGHLAPMHRFERYLREEILNRISGRVVLFIDEIDTLLARPNAERDEFFAVIRAIYNARPDEPNYQRLSICLLGVAQPRDLISDEARTPFNVGRAILLEDFTLQEMEVLAPGLAHCSAHPRQLLEEIFAWTKGHPFMTLRLCEAVVEDPGPERPAAEWIARLVTELFLPCGRVLEPTLNFAEKSFGRNSTRSYAFQMLSLYEQIRAGLEVLADAQAPVQTALRLTGMVAERRKGDHRLLAVRNRIYASVFNDAWVASMQKERLFAEPLRRWLTYGKSSTEVLRGRALDDARDWMHGREDVTSDEREFLLASLEVRQQEADALLLNERLRRRLLRGMTFTAVLLAIALGFAIREFARAQRVAHENASLLENARRIAELEKATMVTSMAIDPRERIHALLIGLRGVRSSLASKRASPPAVVYSLLRAANPILTNRLALGTALRVQSGAISPNGRYRATFGFSSSVWLWDIQKDHLVGVLNGQTDVVRYAAFSPDGRHIVTTGDTGIANIFNVQSGRLERELVGHAGRLNGAAYSPSGEQIVTVGQDKMARIFEAESGRLVQTLVGHTDGVRAGLFTTDGKQVITVANDRRLLLWNVRTGAAERLSTEEIFVSALALSADGKWLATASDDRVARVFPLRSADSKRIELLHPSAVRSTAFSKDGQYLFTACDDGMVRMWSLHTRQQLFLIDNPTSALASISQPGSMENIVEADHSEALDTSPVVTLAGHVDWVRTAVFSPTSSLILTASDDGEARLWEARSGRLVRSIVGDPMGVRSASFSADGQRIVTAGMDKTAKLWRTETGELLRVLKGHVGWVRWATFSPDGHKVATASKDGTASVWDAETGEQLLTLRGHADGLRMVAYSPDGRVLATASDDNSVRLWNTETGERLFVLKGHDQSVWSVVFSPDGRKLLTASMDGTIKLWELSSRECQKTLLGHADGVSSAVFSDDGRQIISAGVDRTIRIWNTEEGDQRQIFEFHAGEVRWAAFSHDGKRAVAGGNDRLTFVFPITLEPWVKAACQTLGREVHSLRRREPDIDGMLHFCRSLDGAPATVHQEEMAPSESRGGTAASP